MSAIKNKTLKPVYIFQGSDEFSKHSALEKIKKTLLTEGFEELDLLIAEDVDQRQIIDACRTLPFMSEKRVIVIRDFKPLLSKKTTEGEQSDNTKNDLEALCAYIQDPEELSCLIFYFHAENTPGAKIKSLISSGAVNVEFDAPKPAELSRWIIEYAKREHKTVGYDEAEHLLMTVGNDFFSVRNELDKLISYIGDRNSIQIEDIEEIVAPSPEYGGFELIEKLFSGDRDGAYKTLRKMLDHGTLSSVILSSLVTQLRSMVLTKTALDEKLGNEYLKDKLNTKSDYAIKMYIQRARPYKREVVERLYDEAVKEERKFKSGLSSDSVSLDRLMILIMSAR